MIKRRQPVLNKIREEYNSLSLPDLDDKEFNIKFASTFEKELGVSLTEVIEACKEDQIFSEFINYLNKWN